MQTARWSAAYVVASIVLAFTLGKLAQWIAVSTRCDGCGHVDGLAFGLVFLATLVVAFFVGLVLVAVRLGLWSEQPRRPPGGHHR